MAVKLHVLQVTIQILQYKVVPDAQMESSKAQLGMNHAPLVHPTHTKAIWTYHRIA